MTDLTDLATQMAGEDARPTLSYAAGRYAPPGHRSGGGSETLRAVLIGLALLSLVASLVVGRMGASGDGYSQLAGMVIGVPLTVVTGLLCTLPSIICAASPLAERWQRITLLVLGLTSLAAAAGATAICFCMPTTHGGC